mmetsp:Transcript_44587/g.96157  ORF Transcript_44587/g.96157 Transcript_44587/m.96157 type:complete len:203 (-) Transcript_44587:214-822(-)
MIAENVVGMVGSEIKKEAATAIWARISRQCVGKLSTKDGSRSPAHDPNRIDWSVTANNGQCRASAFRTSSRSLRKSSGATETSRPRIWPEGCLRRDQPPSFQDVRSMTTMESARWKPNKPKDFRRKPDLTSLFWRCLLGSMMTSVRKNHNRRPESEPQRCSKWSENWSKIASRVARGPDQLERDSRSWQISMREAIPTGVCL